MSRMMHSENSLYSLLLTTELETEKLIRAVFMDAKEQGVDPYEMKGTDGQYVLTPLIVAQANCLNGMATLRACKDGK